MGGSISPDNVLRQYYAKLSVEWEKEAAKLNKSSPPGPGAAHAALTGGRS
jgi:hypothetical protein